MQRSQLLKRSTRRVERLNPRVKFKTPYQLRFYVALVEKRYTYNYNILTSLTYTNKTYAHSS